MMFLSNGQEVHFTPAGESSYETTPEGVIVRFCGQGCSVKSSTKLVSWQDAEELAKNEDFGGGYRVALQHKP